MNTKFKLAFLLIIVVLESQAVMAADSSPCAATLLDESVNSEIIERHIDCIYRAPVTRQFGHDASASNENMPTDYLRMSESSRSNGEPLLFLLIFISLVIFYYSRFARSTK
jgi:hypothetical protein